MEHCQSLKALALQRLEMDENHSRVLGANLRPDLEIVLKRCAFTSAGTSTLIEVLGRNQGPTKLHYCDIDYAVLADGLRGSSRLKTMGCGAQVPEAGTLGDAENEHDDTHHTVYNMKPLYSQHELAFFSEG
jgi:hypothetical protein